jgi:hypothetical protein
MTRPYDPSRVEEAVSSEGYQDRLEERRSDPDSSLYSPEYTGDASLGDVGSGRGFGADLYQLYRAGRIDFPEIAATYEDLTMQVHREDGRMHTLFEGEAGNLAPEPVHQLILSLREDLQDALRQTCLNVNAAAEALIRIADSYAATDEEAATRFGEEIEGDRDDFRGPSHPPLDPPAPGSPPPGEPRPGADPGRSQEEE